MPNLPRCLNALAVVVLFSSTVSRGEGMAGSETCNENLVPKTAHSVITDLLLKKKLETASPAGGSMFPLPPSSIPVVPAAVTSPPLPVLPARTPEDVRAEILELTGSQSALIANLLSERTRYAHPQGLGVLFASVQALMSRVSQVFVEREALVALLLRTIIGHGSLLIMGPPGTGKSDIAERVGENLIDHNGETSVFTIQLTTDTTTSETMGGQIMSEVMEGRMLRRWQEGVLGSRFVILDEFFDARIKFIRGFLRAFNERKYSQGKHTFDGITEVFIAATNKYINEVYAMFRDVKAQATIDRFWYVYVAPGMFEKTSSVLSLAELRRPDFPKLAYDDVTRLNAFIPEIPMASIEVLRAQSIWVAMRRLVKQHEVSELAAWKKAVLAREIRPAPYKSTRVFSGRSFKILLKLIRLEAMIRAVAGNTSSIRVLPEDVDRQVAMFTAMQGNLPKNMTEMTASLEAEPDEIAQYEILEFEQKAIASVLRELHEQESIVNAQVANILAHPDDLEMALVFMREAFGQLHDLDNAEKIGPKQIAFLGGLRTYLHSAIAQKLLKN